MGKYFILNYSSSFLLILSGYYTGYLFFLDITLFLCVLERNVVIISLSKVYPFLDPGCQFYLPRK